MRKLIGKPSLPFALFILLMIMNSVCYTRDVSRLIFFNANKNPKVFPLGRTAQKVNYFIGNNKSKWRTDMPTSKAVLYKELYNKIDLKVNGIKKQVEYDFIVRPGGDISDIQFEYKNIKKAKIDKKGNLIIKTKFGELKHSKPECYQIIKGRKINTYGGFIKIRKDTFGFDIVNYNKDYELIIDPVILIYSTYLGGESVDKVEGITVDSIGCSYAAGATASNDFPIYNPYQNEYKRSFDAFVSKLYFDSDINITVTSPNGGENWQMGTTKTIAWAQTGLTEDVNIDLYKGCFFDSNIGEADATAGSFSWYIPSNQTPGDNYKVKIYQGSVEDHSDDYL